MRADPLPPPPEHDGSPRESADRGPTRAANRSHGAERARPTARCGTGMPVAHGST